MRRVRESDGRGGARRTAVEPRHGGAPKSGSIEGPRSWWAAWLEVAILYLVRLPLLIVVGLKPMVEALGTERSVLVRAGALARLVGATPLVRAAT